MNALRNDTTENKVTGLLLLLFAASLPFDRFYSQTLLIFLLLHTIIQLRTTRIRQLQPTELTLHAGIWLLTIAGTAFSPFAATAFPFWERQCAILLLPLCLCLLPFNLTTHRKLLMNVFVATNCFVILYLFQDALRTMLYYHQPLTSIWSAAYLSHNFAAPLALHATYLSLFCALSFCFCIQAFFEKETGNAMRTIFTLAAVVLIAGLLQLASRAVLGATALACFSLLPFCIDLRKDRIRYLLALAGVTVLSLLLLQHVPSLYQRFVLEMATDLGTQRGAGLASDPRGHRWELALQLVREAPAWGHGSGSEVPLLRERYFQNGLYDSYLNSLNAHNQYISLLIRHGVIGLLCWLATLAVLARRAYLRKDILLGCFLLLMAVSGLSENILDVNKGIFFYAFFLSVLGIRGKNIQSGTAASNPGRVRTVRIRKEKIPS
ncbi:MAG: O-antigen ligase domain-containing protein [Chitinophagaceae bacterium]|nr:MAG: O-antigen ligase domain-containing protein [Chitinophagaceae bacterium]